MQDINIDWESSNLNGDLISIYPNPSIEFRFGRMVRQTHIRILDGMGRMVVEKDLSSAQKATINVIELSSGLYTLMIDFSDDNGTHTQKFVKT